MTEKTPKSDDMVEITLINVDEEPSGCCALVIDWVCRTKFWCWVLCC